METAIRWSPSSTINEQHFLYVDVAGRSFRHCRVESYDGNILSYQTLSISRNVPAFRAFDWSPHTESIAAVGEWSGSATLLKLDDEKSSPLPLPVRSQRPVNAIAFARTGLLAVGLERVRNDSSLNIWDVEHRLTANTSAAASTGASFLEPLRKIASSEGITSIKFFHDQPDTVLAGVKGVCIRLYDIRENTGNPAVQFLTTSVHNIGIDPLDENYFASAGAQKDVTIQIWDRRFGILSSAASSGSGSSHGSQYGPVLEYKKAFEASTAASQPHIWSLRYCRGQRGFLGALASNGMMKVFETKQAYAPGANESQDQASWIYNTQQVAQPQLRTERIHYVEASRDETRHAREEKARVIAFDFTNLAGPKGRPSSIIIRGDKSIKIHELKGRRPAFALSSTGQLVGIDVGYRSKHQDFNPVSTVSERGMYHTSSLDTILGKPEPHSDKLDETMKFDGELMPIGNLTNQRPQGLSSREYHERWFEKKHFQQTPEIGSTLATLDMSRRRCTQGYLFDCQKNMDIVADDPWLRDMWEWVGSKSET